MRGLQTKLNVTELRDASYTKYLQVCLLCKEVAIPLKWHVKLIVALRDAISRQLSDQSPRRRTWASHLDSVKALPLIEIVVSVILGTQEELATENSRTA